MTNEKEFDESLKKLSDLYEEGEDMLHSLSILESERKEYHRLFDVIREMRDLAAGYMQKVHWKFDN